MDFFGVNPGIEPESSLQNKLLSGKWEAGWWAGKAIWRYNLKDFIMRDSYY